MPWRCWLLVEMVEGVTEAGGLGDDVVGAEMNESPMSSEADVDDLVVVVTVDREEAEVTKSLMLSGGNYEERILEVAVERDEAAMTVSVEVAVGEKAHSRLSIIAPAMTHEESPFIWCLPALILRGP